MSDYRGSERDLLARYKGAADEFDVSSIVNVDGDDIFCEPRLMDLTFKELAGGKFDFLYWTSLPLGASPVGLSVDSVRRICEIKRTKDTATGWGRFFTETGLFRVGSLAPPFKAWKRSEVRLTLDYPEDLELVRAVYSRLAEPFSLTDILHLLDRNPELRRINQGLSDRYWRHFARESARVVLKRP